jgi:hypothetical protein
VVQALKFWRVHYWITLAGWLLAAVLNMAGVRAGFATSHLADLTLPAWLYILFRGLSVPDRQAWVTQVAAPKWQVWLTLHIGATPERTALLLFAASSATELAQKYWPAELLGGRGLTGSIFSPTGSASFHCISWTRSCHRLRQHSDRR